MMRTGIAEGWQRDCEDCGSEFSSFPGDKSTRCGNCSATTRLPRCGLRSSADVLGEARCVRPAGHYGHHTYGRKRA